MLKRRDGGDGVFIAERFRERRRVMPCLGGRSEDILVGRLVVGPGEGRLRLRDVRVGPKVRRVLVRPLWNVRLGPSCSRRRAR